MLKPRSTAPLGAVLASTLTATWAVASPGARPNTKTAKRQPADAASPAKFGRPQIRARTPTGLDRPDIPFLISIEGRPQTPSASIVPPLIRPRSHARGGRSFSVLARLLA